MIVSTSHRFIYARVPKTASTSVSAALEPYRRAEDRALIGRIGRRILPGSTHPRLVDFRAHSHWPLAAARIVMGVSWFDRAYRFTVVRHPLAWAQSFYAHLVRHKTGPRYHAAWGAALAGGSFDAFAEALPDHAPPPQLAMLVDGEGRLLAEHVIRVEALEEELAPVRARLGIAIEVPHLNIGGREERPVDPATRRRVEEAFAGDYAQFGYDSDRIARPVDRDPGEASRAAGAVLARIGPLPFSPWEPLVRQLPG